MMRTRPKLQCHLPNPCPVDGCLNHRRTGQLMCGTCWSAVPIEKRQAVNRTWRELRHRDKADMAATRMALSAYRRASDDATAAARGALAP